jgi:hypothetical protein
MDTYTDVVSNTVCFEPTPLGPSPLSQPRNIVCAPRPADRPRPDRQIVSLPHHIPPAEHRPACAVCGGPGQQLVMEKLAFPPDRALSMACVSSQVQTAESIGATNDDGWPSVDIDHGVAPSAAAVPLSPTTVASSNYEPGGQDGIDGSSPAPQPHGGGGSPDNEGGLHGACDEGSSSGGEEAAGRGYHGVNPAWPTGGNPVAADAGRGGAEEEDGRALPFIVVGSDGRAEVGEEAAALLGRLRGPVAVVAVVGPYRSGKSFLLNRVLLGRAGPGGFPVGGTVEACTKGLWMWSKALPATGPDGSPVNVLLVDTEGELPVPPLLAHPPPTPCLTAAATVRRQFRALKHLRRAGVGSRPCRNTPLTDCLCHIHAHAHAHATHSAGQVGRERRAVQGWGC